MGTGRFCYIEARVQLYAIISIGETLTGETSFQQKKSIRQSVGKNTWCIEKSHETSHHHLYAHTCWKKRTHEYILNHYIQMVAAGRFTNKANSGAWHQIGSKRFRQVPQDNEAQLSETNGTSQRRKIQDSTTQHRLAQQGISNIQW